MTSIVRDASARRWPPSGPAASFRGVAETPYPPISDYAIIGDCRSAALVSTHGGIEWLCLPRFDSPALFAAILDRSRGGHFTVRPVGAYRSERRYLERTNVLETTFHTERGTLRLLDLMPVDSEAAKRRELWPEHEILRRVDCVAGEVDVEVTCDPRPEYGAKTPRLRRAGRFGFCHEHGSVALHVRSEIPLAASDAAPGLRGRAVLRAGDRRYVSLVYTREEPAVLPVFGTTAERKIERTVQWWRGWAARCRYDGPYADHVIRSALALKLLTYAPSGAVVAAPTTSLPEAVGGGRNWDYRYCWLRDASLTFGALVDLGYDDEAHAFLVWMLDSTRLTWPQLQILYDVHGEARVPERELTYLDGYRASRPVRIGNAAENQLQLDVYGEVVDAVFEYVRREGTLRPITGRTLRGLGETVCRLWREPDEGIWEVRSGRRHHTYSKVMCWVALDRLVKLHEAGHLEAIPVDRFRRERDAVRAEVEARGFSEAVQSYVSVFDGRDVDASLLLLARYGFADPRSPRMLATCERIRQRLGTHGLLYRYHDDDGLAGGEGAFGICSFWWADVLCRQGKAEAARQTFEHLCAHANDVGLFAEEIDPKTGELLGNFPQAFTHVGLIDAALALAESAGAPVGAVSRDAHTSGEVRQ